MISTETRLTLIATPAGKTPMGWKDEGARTRLAFVGSVAEQRIALAFAVEELGLDVERVVVDRGEKGDFLNLLLRIPRVFRGEAVFVRTDGSGLLSVASAGRERVLLSLSADEIRSYLASNNLVCGSEAERRTA